MEEKLGTILVVDDTEDNLDLLEFALKRKPVYMLRANSGKDCLAIAQEKNPDVILLDIQMPEMDGFETLRRLKENPLTAGIPVIFLTAQRKDATSIETGLQLGADEYLTKPIDTEELLVRTKMLIRVKRAEAELERTKADFMAMLVHDLRSPLNGIKGVIDLVSELRSQNKQMTEDHFKLLESANESAGRMLHLINDILDLSKLEAGKMKIDKQPIDFWILVDIACREMEIQYRNKSVALEKNCPQDFPKVVVDPQAFIQVLMNLLNNALKFTRANDSVSVKAELVSLPSPAGLEDNSFIKVTVKDTGIGIPKEELPYLFERYKQASSAKRITHKGTGLGLSICKLLVEAHGGTISVESEVGSYTTFTFTIPVKK
jgi:signal transduction histidine kinase